MQAEDGAGDHWDQSGGALSPKVLTDNVDIGDGNITLNAADGRILRTYTGSWLKWDDYYARFNFSLLKGNSVVGYRHLSDYFRYLGTRNS